MNVLNVILHYGEVRRGDNFMEYISSNVKREKWKDFYRLAYRTGYYTLEQLIKEYEDYESHRNSWARSSQYGNFIVGQLALLQVINEIKAGILYKDPLKLSADKIVDLVYDEYQVTLLRRLLDLLFNTGDNTNLYSSLVDSLLNSKEGKSLFEKFAIEQILMEYSLNEVLNVIDEDSYTFDSEQKKILANYVKNIFNEFVKGEN